MKQSTSQKKTSPKRKSGRATATGPLARLAGVGLGGECPEVDCETDLAGIERVWSKVEVTGFCWNWTGYRTPAGYGTLTLAHDGNVRCVKAHRLVYRLLVGPIPDELTVDHLCRNPACVNPDHFDLVTRAENTRRGYTISRANAAKTECPRGHAYTAENTMRTSAGARTCRECHRLRCREYYYTRGYGAQTA